MIPLLITIDLGLHTFPLAEVEPEWRSNLELLIGFGFGFRFDPSSGLDPTCVQWFPIPYSSVTPLPMNMKFD